MNLLQRIFKREPEKTLSRVELMGYNPVFTSFNGTAYENDVFRAGVDAIARNTAKLKGTHIRTFEDGSIASGNAGLNYLLQQQPNPHMSAYDMIYKIVTRTFTDNNSFTYIDRNPNGIIAGYYPMNVQSCQFLADPSGSLFCEFTFKNGRVHTLPYSDVIHIRRHFANNDLLGETNDALMPAIELAHTENEGIANAIKSGANIQGILKFTQLLSPEKLKENKEAFMADYLQLNNSGGVVATDQTMEYEPIDHKPAIINAAEMTETRKKIYSYLGISEAFVNSTYTDDEYSAVFESTLEPIALQLSLEFTNKSFTRRQIIGGNSIEFKAARLQFISNDAKVALLKECVPMGILQINQALEILGLPPRPDGYRTIQSLNYIDQLAATEYQLANAGAKKEVSDDEGN